MGCGSERELLTTCSNNVGLRSVVVKQGARILRLPVLGAEKWGV